MEPDKYNTITYIDYINQIKDESNLSDEEFDVLKDAIYSIKSYDPDEVDSTPEPEIDENLDLINFYGKLLVEKIARLPHLGKLKIQQFEINRVLETNAYDISIEIDHNFIFVSPDEVIKTMEDINQLKDDNNIISVKLDDVILIKVSINAESIRSLTEAEKASTKYNL